MAFFIELNSCVLEKIEEEGGIKNSNFPVTRKESEEEEVDEQETAAVQSLLHPSSPLHNGISQISTIIKSKRFEIYN